ncbi:MAG: M23 family metallopeptidase [Acaryochloris sp. RU_4_1]|nr:M23 family metallopeptidase [Acaryochloris sp. RU_4_1]NJR53957.1 M23 family metallopeptidase [Acaryochloris sp. CRU_2_0]
MNEQAPQQSPLIHSQQCDPQFQESPAPCRPAVGKKLWHSAKARPIALATLILIVPPLLLWSLLHPQSPFRTSLKGKMGGADIVEANQAHPPIRPPVPIQAAAKPPIFSLALQAQPTLNSPLQGFCHPLWGQGWLSQGIRGVTHNGRMEYAYDYATGIGTPVYAMRAGRIISIQDRYPDHGGDKAQIHRFNHVWLEHDGGYRSAYVHLQQGFRQRVNLKVGDQVKVGQIIGYSGNSGWSSGPHLHVEVHRAEARWRFAQTVPFAISTSCNLGRQATIATKLPRVEDSQ